MMFQLIIDSHGLSAEIQRISTVPMSGFQARSDCYVRDRPMQCRNSDGEEAAPRSLYLQLYRFTLAAIPECKI